ncbi:Far upstream element-binding protein 1, partial [Araneus ventricosus]
AVKSMIDQIISKANSPFPPEPGHVPDGQFVTEMMIPGPKVGLLIGKGGENIRNLQEKGGVKMVLIQEGPQQTIHDKPLRISGDPQKVEFAKQMVIDLLAQKDMEVSIKFWTKSVNGKSVCLHVRGHANAITQKLEKPDG